MKKKVAKKVSPVASPQKAAAKKSPAAKKGSGKTSAGLIVRDAQTIGTESVASSWQRLEKWLAVHHPKLFKALRPPATAKQIETAEKAIGQRLPDSVRESYLIHDGHKRGGGSGLLFGLPLLPLADIVKVWRQQTEIYKDSQKPKRLAEAAEWVSCFPPESIRPCYFHPGWIPISEDAGGNFLALDLNPDSQGFTGQVIAYGRDEHCRPVFARSFGQFLSDIADELEAGNFLLAADPDDDEYLIFRLAMPKQKHFHSAGKEWAKAKLGIKR